MVSQKVKIVNAQGFHMRPASTFVQTMGAFNSNVVLKVNDTTVNGKSLMNLVASCIKFGTEIEVQCDGNDEQEALASAVELIESGFGEE